MKKLMCILLAVCFFAALCACGKDKGTDEMTAQEPYVMRDISGIPSPVKINGKEIPYAVFRYYFAFCIQFKKLIVRIFRLTEQMIKMILL